MSRYNLYLQQSYADEQERRVDEILAPYAKAKKLKDYIVQAVMFYEENKNNQLLTPELIESIVIGITKGLQASNGLNTISTVQQAHESPEPEPEPEKPKKVGSKRSAPKPKEPENTIISSDAQHLMESFGIIN